MRDENLAQVVEESGNSTRDSLARQEGIVEARLWWRRYSNNDVVGVVRTGTTSGSRVPIDSEVFF